MDKMDTLHRLEERRDGASREEANMLDGLIADLEFEIFFPDTPEDRDYLDPTLNPDSVTIVWGSVYDNL